MGKRQNIWHNKYMYEAKCPVFLWVCLFVMIVLITVFCLSVSLFPHLSTASMETLSLFWIRKAIFFSKDVWIWNILNLGTLSICHGSIKLTRAHTFTFAERLRIQMIRIRIRFIAVRGSQIKIRIWLSYSDTHLGLTNGCSFIRRLISILWAPYGVKQKIRLL